MNKTFKKFSSLLSVTLKKRPPGEARAQATPLRETPNLKWRTNFKKTWTRRPSATKMTKMMKIPSMSWRWMTWPWTKNLLTTYSHKSENMIQWSLTKATLLTTWTRRTKEIDKAHQTARTHKYTFRISILRIYRSGVTQIVRATLSCGPQTTTSTRLHLWAIETLTNTVKISQASKINGRIINHPGRKCQAWATRRRGLRCKWLMRRKVSKIFRKRKHMSS